MITWSTSFLIIGIWGSREENVQASFYLQHFYKVGFMFISRLELPIIKRASKDTDLQLFGDFIRLLFRTSCNYTGNVFRACAISVNADFKKEVPTGASP